MLHERCIACPPQVISKEMFNVSEIQRTRISQTTLSSAAETEIHVRTQIHEHHQAGTKDRVKKTDAKNPTIFGQGQPNATLLPES